MQSSRPIYIKRLVIAIVIILALFAVYFISQFSRLSIQVSDGGNYEAVIINQDNLEEKTVNVVNGNASLFITKGDYQVVISSEEKSFVEVVSTAGFLQNKKINADARKEDVLQFVGIDPQGCSYFDKTLVSFACQGNMDSIVEHKPSQGSNPTFKLSTRTKDNATGTVQDYDEVAGEHIYLVKRTGFSDNASNILVKLGDENTSAGVDEVYELNQLDNFKQYYLEPYKSGLLIYNSSLDELLFFDGLPSGSGAQKAGSKVPKYTENKPSELNTTEVSALGDMIAVSFSNRGVIDNENGKTVLRVGDLENFTEYEFDLVLNDMSLCGDGLICALNKKELRVYSLSESEAKLEFKVIGVENYKANGELKRIYIAQEQKILSMNVQTQSGHVSLNHPGYSNDFIDSTSNGYGYISHIRNSYSLIAIRIVEGEVNDSILSKVDALQKSPLITNLSVYGKQILVVPDLGDIIYIEETQEFNYDPKRKAETNASIIKLIEELGIPSSGYSVVNVLE